MVIGLLILTSIPVVTGVAQGYSAQVTAKQRAEDAKRMRKAYISVECNIDSPQTVEVHDMFLVLRDGKVYIDEWDPRFRRKPSYTTEAFFLEYPDPDRDPMEMGLVSQVQDVPPLLNWIYVKEENGELRYGNRSESRSEVVGPWDWTEDELNLTLFEEEGFVAVEPEDSDDPWEVYFQVEDGWVKEKLGGNRTVLPVRLERRLVPEEVAPKAA
jgi:hypothetical protein